MIDPRSTAVKMMGVMELPGEPRRVVDNDYGDLCWVIYEFEDDAFVVYDDDPATPVATGNHPGRFVTHQEQEG